MAKKEEEYRKEQETGEGQTTGQEQKTGEGQTAGESQNNNEGNQTGQEQATGEGTSIVIAKAKERFPDSEFQSDEEALNALLKEMDSMKDWQDREMKANEEIRKAIESEPAVGKLLTMITEGAGLRDALPYIMDEETLSSLTPAEDEPDYEAWKQNRDARVKELEQEEQEMQQFKESLDATEQRLQKVAESRGMDDEQAKEYAEFVTNTIKEVINGDISEETLALLDKGRRYDRDLADFQEVQKVKEKNKKAEEEKARRQSGDGIPKLSSKGGRQEKESTKKPKTPFDEGIEGYKRRKKL